MKLFISGTDTDVGKTIFASALADALNATYWKPIQAGALDHSDSDTVRALSGLPDEQILAEGYRLTTPCSPHRAAEIDGIEIDPARLQLPCADPLIVEGAGGLLVPVNRQMLVIDLVAAWHLPVVLVARTTLGTINHSLLSIEALKARNIELLGIAFVGEANVDSENVICEFGRARRLGLLPVIDPLDPPGLAKAFAENFDTEDFR